MEEVAEGVFRLGSRWVNFYLVRDDAGLTLVDTGFPGYADQVATALRSLGSKANVKAIVLTHTHADHIGGAAALSETSGAPVHVHTGEADIATGAAKAGNPKGFASNLWRPGLMAFLGHAIANKGAGRVTVPAVTKYEADDVLDVPGGLRVLFTPGHSVAHSALLLQDRRVLFCGDALATLNVATGATGPMLHPFNQDRAQAVGSLNALEKVDADVVLPGHGEPWRGTPGAAVSLARRGV